MFRQPLLVLVTALAVVRPAAATEGLVSREAALASVFPDATIAAERVFLSAEQVERAGALSGGAPPSALIARYVARREGMVVGRAYVDTHVVRTKRESLLVSLSADGLVRRIEVTAFLEPREYLAPVAWLRQYEGRPLDDELGLQRAIRPIAGATLSAGAANDAVRRVLAIDLVLEGGPE